MGPISFYSIMFSLLGGFAAIMPPYLVVLTCAIAAVAHKSERELLVENEGYSQLMEKAYDLGLFVN